MYIVNEIECVYDVWYVDLVCIQKLTEASLIYNVKIESWSDKTKTKHFQQITPKSSWRIHAISSVSL